MIDGQIDWQSRWCPAPSALSSVLAGVWSVRAGHGEPLSARVLPDASSCIVFGRDGAVLRTGGEIGAPWGAASVAGPRSSPLDITLGAGGQIFIVQLRRAGARALLGVPLSHLTDRFEAADSVVGRMPSEFMDVILSDADDRSCVGAIEGWISRRLRDGPSDTQLATALSNEVAGSIGNLPVEQLAARVGLSRRHLLRIMQERFGVSPKLFGRIVRFDCAVQLGRFRRELSWSEIAHETGYADQPHMARDFAALGGIRPSDLRGSGGATLW
ncbi:MAG: helix-turn-helix domain-containing protein [Pseudomonadota bacterium]